MSIGALFFVPSRCMSTCPRCWYVGIRGPMVRLTWSAASSSQPACAKCTVTLVATDGSRLIACQWWLRRTADGEPAVPSHLGRPQESVDRPASLVFQDFGDHRSGSSCHQFA